MTVRKNPSSVFALGEDDGGDVGGKGEPGDPPSTGKKASRSARKKSKERQVPVQGAAELLGNGKVDKAAEAAELCEKTLWNGSADSANQPQHFFIGDSHYVGDRASNSEAPRPEASDVDYGLSPDVGADPFSKQLSGSSGSQLAHGSKRKTRRRKKVGASEADVAGLVPPLEQIRPNTDKESTVPAQPKGSPTHGAPLLVLPEDHCTPGSCAQRLFFGRQITPDHSRFASQGSARSAPEVRDVQGAAATMSEAEDIPLTERGLCSGDCRPAKRKTRRGGRKKAAHMEEESAVLLSPRSASAAAEEARREAELAAQAALERKREKRRRLKAARQKLAERVAEAEAALRSAEEQPEAAAEEELRPQREEEPIRPSLQSMVGKRLRIHTTGEVAEVHALVDQCPFCKIVFADDLEFASPDVTLWVREDDVEWLGVQGVRGSQVRIRSLTGRLSEYDETGTMCLVHFVEGALAGEACWLDEDSLEATPTKGCSMKVRKSSSRGELIKHDGRTVGWPFMIKLENGSTGWYKSQDAAPIFEVGCLVTVTAPGLFDEITEPCNEQPYQIRYCHGAKEGFFDWARRCNFSELTEAVESIDANEKRQRHESTDSTEASDRRLRCESTESGHSAEPQLREKMAQRLRCESTDSTSSAAAQMREKMAQRARCESTDSASSAAALMREKMAQRRRQLEAADTDSAAASVSWANDTTSAAANTDTARSEVAPNHSADPIERSPSPLALAVGGRPEPGDVVQLGASVHPSEFRRCPAVVTKVAESHCTVVVLDEDQRFGIGECWPSLDDVDIECSSWRLDSRVVLSGLKGPRTSHLNGFSGRIAAHPKQGHPTFLSKPSDPQRPQFTLCVRLDDPVAAGQKSVVLEPRFLTPYAAHVRKVTGDLSMLGATLASLTSLSATPRPEIEEEAVDQAHRCGGA
mmetsp:Transcript_25235/g.44814  ORF Transcript_25235/g.44814 Transcript_25235/m.44814 type:complete len:925 (-) Transcript_25235:104-2878(-)